MQTKAVFNYYHQNTSVIKKIITGEERENNFLPAEGGSFAIRSNELQRTVSRLTRGCSSDRSYKYIHATNEIYFISIERLVCEVRINEKKNIYWDDF